jgi:hypothetical protein
MVATVHEIVVGHTRLRVERDPATGEHSYFINGRPCDVNAYLAVTQAHLDRAESRLYGKAGWRSSEPGPSTAGSLTDSPG